LTSQKTGTSYKRLFVIAALTLALDQITKFWIVRNLAFNSYFYPQDTDVIEVISGFFYIVHIGNEGAAWGILSGYGMILALFTFVAFGMVYWFRESLELHRKVMQIAFGMLTGGATGNLLDRLVHGHVIDFLDFHFNFTIPVVLPNGRYPAFNIADCGIVIGVFIYLIASFYPSKPIESKESTAEQ